MKSSRVAFSAELVRQANLDVIKLTVDKMLADNADIIIVESRTFVDIPDDETLAELLRQLEGK